MSEWRPAELAGRWYPGTSAGCDRFFDGLEEAGVTANVADPCATIVPHAGWVYSGAVAWRAMRRVKAAHPNADLVMVFGGHLGARDRPRIFIEGGWDTPFGPIPIAKGLAEDLSMAMESELETPADYYDDNAVEVLMPMVKKLWPEAQAITVGVPPTADAPNIGVELLDLAKRRGFLDIVVIGSTDLTHYGPNYDFQPHGRGRVGLDWVKTKNDPEIIERMKALDTTKLLWMAQRQHNACCPGAAAACISAARKLGAKRGEAEYTTSFDVRPNGEEPSSFVGYAGVVFGV